MEEDIAQDKTEVTRLAFRCGYLGDRFFGSQVQAGERTAEGEFIAACLRLSLFTDPRSGHFQAAGRTDRGVHARGQVFCISTPFPERAISLLRFHLPADLWVTGYARVPFGFSPRHGALHRTYRYFFGETGLDTSAMDRAARAFVGTHDFSLFARPDARDPVRTVLSARVFVESGIPVFEIRGRSFLWHMVRYMAAALCMVGSGDADEDMVSLRLSGDTSVRLSPAQPAGLVLWDVEFGFSFLPVPAGRKASAFLEREYFASRARACVIGHLAKEAVTPARGTGDGGL